MADFRSYSNAGDYAITNRHTDHKSVKKTEESHYTSTKQERSNEKPVTKASGPMLFTPPVVHDNEIKAEKSGQKEQQHNKMKNLYEQKKPNLISESLSSHKTGQEQGKSDLPEDESSVDEESVDLFIAMLEESSSIDHSSKPAKNGPFQARKFMFNFDESSSFEESSSIEKVVTKFEESSSIHDESSSLFIESSCFEESSSLFIESSCFEESSSITMASIDEESSFFDCESSSMDKLETPVSVQNELPIVKMPVVLSMVEIDLDIFDSFLLHLPVKEITKVDWSVYSLECHVPLPARSLFVKGVLVADIEYVEDNGCSSLQKVKMQVPFNTTTNVDWLTGPEIPRSYHAEYTYRDVEFHQELSQQYAHPIKSELKNIHIVWHNEFMSENGLLNVQGRVQMFIHLLQNQYIKLAD